jgi:hypothetical protein
MAVMRRRVVATRGLEMAFLTWVSIVLLAVFPTLSTAYKEEGLSHVSGKRKDTGLTFSTSASNSSLSTLVEVKARWLTLISGKMRCFEMISAEGL